MIRYRCDGCGLDLAHDGSNHYILKMEAFAAAGKLEFTEADLQKDHQSEIEGLIRQAGQQSFDALEDQVFRAMRFDLCPDCHRQFLQKPLQWFPSQKSNSD